MNMYIYIYFDIIVGTYILVKKWYVTPITSGNQTRLATGNPSSKWRILAGNIIYKWWIFEQATFDCRRVVLVLLAILIGTWRV